MTEEKRILILGFNNQDESIETKDDENIVCSGYSIGDFWLPGCPEIPTIFDFDIVLLDLNSLAKHHLDELNKRKEEFIEFLKSGGVLVSTVKNYDYKYNIYGWCPVIDKFDLINKPGDTINPTKYAQNFGKLFNEYKESVKWLAVFKYLDNEETILAENRAGHPISVIFNYGNGKIIFIPNFNLNESNKFNFQRTLIDIVKKIQITSEISSKKPEWLVNKEYIISNEMEIDEQVEDLTKKKKAFESARKLLYEDGTNLTNTVSNIFSEFGFEVLTKESEGREDIEIVDENSNFHAIVEVTGSVNPINIDKIRQLFDWYSQKIEEDEDIKAILIANALKELNPIDRKKSYTESAIKLAKKNEFLLMTTYDLFKMYKLFQEGGIDKKKIIQTLSKNN